MQGGSPAISQAASERGGIIGTGYGEVCYNRVNTSRVLRIALATNGCAPLLEEQEGAPLVDPILYCVMTDEELRAIDPLLHVFTVADQKLVSMYATLCMLMMDPIYMV